MLIALLREITLAHKAGETKGRTLGHDRPERVGKFYKHNAIYFPLLFSAPRICVIATYDNPLIEDNTLKADAMSGFFAEIRFPCRRTGQIGNHD
jgi:hypothetical protein